MVSEHVTAPHPRQTSTLVTNRNKTTNENILSLGPFQVISIFTYQNMTGAQKTNKCYAKNGELKKLLIYYETT